MTLLAGAYEEGRVVVAADSLEHFTNAGYGRMISKLRLLPEHELLTAIHGDSGREPQFRQFLIDKKFSDWESLDYELPYEVLRLDRESAPHGFSAIVAGRLAGEIGVRAFGGDRDRHRLEGADGRSYFVGYDRLAAKVGWDVSEALASSVDLEERFLTVMDTVVTAGQLLLGLPVKAWRVTADRGCEQIRPEQSVRSAE